MNLNTNNDMNDKYKIGIIGLGYVGLPLACMFAGKYPVVGFDTNRRRVDEISRGIDHNGDICSEKLAEAAANGFRCTSDSSELKDCNVYIVAVPTPVDENHRPDLTPLVNASEVVGGVISRGDMVVYESTVFPGATEDVCAPVVEKVSGLKAGTDFHLGYSPERINPGDMKHRVENIKKITSGSTPESAAMIDALYSSVLLNGTYLATSIKVAEAAKIVENTQRDVNIAFMNEMTMALDAMGINSHDVVDAAGSKWNFLPFYPGLVGGHCIGVDPYYMIERAGLAGVYLRLTAEARRINESMGSYVAKQIVKGVCLNGKMVKDMSLLLLGFTFKENCRDTRNTKVVDIYRQLKSFTGNIQVFDPLVDPVKAQNEYGIKVDTDEQSLRCGEYDAVVYCVAHDCFSQLDVAALCRPGGLIFDVKGTIPVSKINKCKKMSIL